MMYVLNSLSIFEILSSEFSKNTDKSVYLEALLSDSHDSRCRLRTHYNDDLYHIRHFHYAATEDMVKFSYNIVMIPDLAKGQFRIMI